MPKTERERERERDLKEKIFLFLTHFLWILYRKFLFYLRKQNQQQETNQPRKEWKRHKQANKQTKFTANRAISKTYMHIYIYIYTHTQRQRDTQTDRQTDRDRDNFSQYTCRDTAFFVTLDNLPKSVPIDQILPQWLENPTTSSRGTVKHCPLSYRGRATLDHFLIVTPEKGTLHAFRRILWRQLRRKT